MFQEMFKAFDKHVTCRVMLKRNGDIKRYFLRRFYSFIFRQRGREGETEGKKY